MDAAPLQALRGSDETSLGMAIEMVKDGRADAVVSAGNSGAFLAIALVRCARSRASRVRRSPSCFPRSTARSSCSTPARTSTAGRNGWRSSASWASAYARAVLGIAEPRVGIISVGEERVKGNAQTIEAAQILDVAPIRFIGNVEGKDIFYQRGRCRRRRRASSAT